MRARRHSDDLFQFSYRLFKVEYVIFKLFFLALSIYGLYKIADREFGFKFTATSAHVEAQDPCHATLPTFEPE